MGRRATLPIGLVLLLVLGSQAWAAERSGSSWTEVSREKTGKISVLYRPGAPWAMVDENGQLNGFEIELFRYFLNYLEKNHGVTLEVEWIPEPSFSTLYKNVREGTGGVFGLSKVSIQEARRTEVGFSPPYLNNVPVLVTHESLGELTSLTELAGYTGVSVQGTSMESAMIDMAAKELPELEIEYLERSADICYRIADRDSKSFAILDLISAWQLIDKLPLRRQTLGSGNPEPYGIIVPLGSDWELPLTQFLEG